MLQRWETFQKDNHLHRGTLELCQSDHQVLGYLPDQGPSPWLLSLAGRPALGRVLVVPNFFHLRMMEAIVFLGTFNAADIFRYPSPDLCLDTILSQSSTVNSFDLIAWFLLWIALSTVGPYIDRCVSRMIIGNRTHLSSISSLIVKGLNSYVNKGFLFGRSNQMYLYSPSYIRWYLKVLYRNPA